MARLASSFGGASVTERSTVTGPHRIVLDAHTSAIITGAGTEESDPHLPPSRDVAGYSFLLNGRQLLLDLTWAFERAFRDWILRNRVTIMLLSLCECDLTHV